jgi:hypothetical protein
LVDVTYQTNCRFESCLNADDLSIIHGNVYSVPINVLLEAKIFYCTNYCEYLEIEGITTLYIVLEHTKEYVRTSGFCESLSPTPRFTLCLNGTWAMLPS